MLWVMAERNQGHIHHHRRQKCDYFKGKTYFLLFALLVPVAVSDKKKKRNEQRKIGHYNPNLPSAESDNHTNI